MNTEDDGARGDAEQPQQQPNGADDDAGAESVQDAATPPPAEPPVEPPPADQLGAETTAEAVGDDAGGTDDADDTGGAGSTTEPPTAAAFEDTGADPWEEATSAHEAPGDEPPSGADAGADAGAGASGAAGSGPTTDEYARRFLDSVDGFLGNVFREASEFVDRTTRRTTPPPRAEQERMAPEDYTGRVLDSVEGWMGDFFRGASVARTAAGFGRAAAGSAFRARQRADDVWAQATSAHQSDASRECRYCPFCQTMAVVRNSRPELYEQIGDTAKTLVDLIRQAAEQSRRPRR